MKFLKKNIFWAKLYLCTEYSSELTFKKELIEDDIIVIKYDENIYGTVKGIVKSKIYPSKRSAILNFIKDRYSIKPQKVGDYFVSDLQHVYCFENDKEEIDINSIIREQRNRNVETKSNTI